MRCVLLLLLVSAFGVKAARMNKAESSTLMPETTTPEKGLVKAEQEDVSVSTQRSVKGTDIEDGKQVDRGSTVKDAEENPAKSMDSNAKKGDDDTAVQSKAAEKGDDGTAVDSKAEKGDVDTAVHGKAEKDDDGTALDSKATPEPDGTDDGDNNGAAVNKEPETGNDNKKAKASDVGEGMQHAKVVDKSEITVPKKAKEVSTKEEPEGRKKPMTEDQKKAAYHEPIITTQYVPYPPKTMNKKMHKLNLMEENYEIKADSDRLKLELTAAKADLAKRSKEEEAKPDAAPASSLPASEPKHLKIDAAVVGKQETAKHDCALLFFGLVTHFDVSLPSIKTHILDHNPGCDIYAHTYNVDSTTNKRNDENNEPIHAKDVYQLTPNVVMDTEEQFNLARDTDYFLQYFPPEAGWQHPISMINMVKQWHSIDKVWQFMHQNEGANTYKHVGLFRLDVQFEDDIYVHDGAAVIPDWGNFYGKNDRMFYGSRQHAEVWATHRFSKVEAYLEHLKAEDKLNEGLISEAFMTFLLKDIPYDARPICMLRVRANGKVRNDDCQAKSSTFAKKNLMQSIGDVAAKEGEAKGTKEPDVVNEAVEPNNSNPALDLPRPAMVTKYSSLASSVGLDVADMEREARAHVGAAVASEQGNTAKPVAAAVELAAVKQMGAKTPQEFLQHCTESGHTAPCCRGTLNGLIMTISIAMAYSFAPSGTCPDLALTMGCEELKGALRDLTECPDGYELETDDGGKELSAELIGTAWDEVFAQSDQLTELCRTAMTRECEVESFAKHVEEMRESSGASSLFPFISLATTAVVLAL